MKKKRILMGLCVWIPFRKMLIYMKLLCVFLLGTSMLLHAGAYSQQAKVTLKVREMSLNDVLQQVSQKTQCDILYNLNFIKDMVVRDLQVENEELTDFLNELLPRYGLIYSFDNNVVVIKKAEQRPQKKEFRIQGVVTDDNKIPLPGVTVLIKNSSLGTVTDVNGRYVLTVPAIENMALVFSFVGMETREIQYSGSETINVVLKEKKSELSEVVVTGIFTRRAESFTGSAQSFTKEELRKVGNSNLLQSLKNIDPSFNIMENLVDGSNPNVMPEIQLRGQSGFPDLKGEYQTNPNQPLFILDGFEVSLTKVMDMDMNRIESVTLLKDAAAKAIYGSKAANGVVVIETHRPVAGKMQVTYTGSLNISMPDLSSYDLADAREKLQVEKDAGLYIYKGNDALRQYDYDRDYNRILEEVLRGVNTDWLSKPLRTGTGHKHVLYLEGGDENFRYGVDFSYNNVKGVMKDSERNTVSGGITLSYRYKNILLRNNLEVTYNKGINSPWGDFSEYARMNPYFRSEDENGKINKLFGGTVVTGSVVPNPIWNTTINTNDFSEYTQFTNNFYLEWLLSCGLKMTGRISITRNDSGNEIFLPASHTDFISYSDEDSNRKGTYEYGDGNDFNLAADVNANYSKSFGRHLIFVNAGWSINDNSSHYTKFMAEGFPNDYLEDITFARQYYKDSRPSGTEHRTRDVGVLFALNYSYADRYLLDGSFRVSASSQFGRDNRWGKFWSAGIGWNIHKEKFAQELTFLDQLRIRASIGFTGSQNFNSYQSKATYSYNSTDSYLGAYGAFLLGIENSKLKWQRKYDRNIGLDLSVLERRLTLRLDYYAANTDDLLTDVTIPSSTGFRSYKENLGEVQNRGIEFRIAGKIWADAGKGDFLNIYVGGTHNSNKIKKISNFLASYNEQQVEEVKNKPITRYIEGQSMNVIWAVPSYGIDPVSGRDILVRSDGQITHTWDAGDLAVCGDTEPKLRGNCGFNFDYRGMSLNVGMTWIWGGQIYNQTLVDKVENADLAYNVDRRVFSDRWHNPGDISHFKDIRNRTITRPTQRFVEDQNEWTLSSINLSYDLDRILPVRKWGIRRLRIAFDMNDVCRISSVKIERGTAYPFARSFSFSLQTMF